LGITRVLPWYHSSIIRIFPGYHVGIIRVLLGYHFGIRRVLHGYHLSIIRVLSGYHYVGGNNVPQAPCSLLVVEVLSAKVELEEEELWDRWSRRE
jgi:hypothetical protein